ncbi:sigma-70 family RNA polymerase sigma factor [Anabaena sphaerica FACHB-251]|uniref:Sigma-70 family RNA polymerase sigma factor n=1 Tax=Anabaena sphaerica FACHB-251 TaxID=2692883 RepID=A0A927A3T3_9NOST|nr:sigma-70 family RNA polymerase sigma factor [Anabaena sphaerica]MBD2296828.1 sigma-70 family RNA polymerase sigma factor [Anabaena sphaerica FACHB-251]
MPDRLLLLDDLKNANTPEQVAALFQKLGYNVVCQMLDVELLELSERSVQAVNQVYLIANQGNAELQVILFQLHPYEWTSFNAVTHRMQAIANSICQRDSSFLLLATKDYKQLMLVSPHYQLNTQMDLKVNIQKYLINIADPNYYDLNRLEKIAARLLNPQTLHRLQHEALNFKEPSKKYEFQDTVGWYLQKIGRIKLLKPDEEIILARQVAQLEEIQKIIKKLEKQLHRPPQEEEIASKIGISTLALSQRIYYGKLAKNQLVQANLRLVFSIAKNYTNRGLELLDLIQEGNLGLIKAVEKFDYTKGNKLSTYATWWIKQMIRIAIANQSRTIRLPVHLWEKISLVKKTAKLLTQEIGRIPKQKEIAATLGMTDENLQSLIKYTLPTTSLDTPIGTEEDTILVDIIESSGDTPEDWMLKSFLIDELESFLEILKPRERKILEMRYGLDDGYEKNLAEIGRKINISRERVRQIVNKTLNTLRLSQPRKRIKQEFIDEHKISQSLTSPLVLSSVSSNIENLKDANVNNKLQTVDIQIHLTQENQIMEINSTNLTEQFASLEQTFHQLSEQLIKAAKALQNPGIPLAEDLILQLNQCQKDFIQLQNITLELAKRSQISSQANTDTISSLTDIKDLIQTITDSENEKLKLEKLRSDALRVLQRVLAISHQIDNDFHPLKDCRVKAQELYKVISQSQSYENSEIQSLADGNHPFSKLVTLIEVRESADYQRLEELRSTVTQGLGMPLALAALTGGLIIREESIPELPLNFSTEVDEETSSLKSSPAARLEVNQKAKEESNEGYAQLEIALPEHQIIVNSQPIETLTIIPEEPAENKLEQKIENPILTQVHTHQKAFVEPDVKEDIEPQYQPTSKDIEPKNITATNDHANQELLEQRQKIWHLLRDKKQSLAYHLAHCLETIYPKFHPHLPSKIIRGAILGLHVRYDAGLELGQIANNIKSDFTNFNDDCFVDEDNEWNQAISLLLVTATLRPALLAPNTNAAVILHSLRLGEGLNQLYKYCQIIAKYGNQRLALDITAIKKVISQTVWENELAALRQEVENWWSQAQVLTMSYDTAKAVWNQWLQPNQLIHSLLLPVRQNDVSKLDIAKQNMQRLSNETQINEEVNRTQREIGLLRASSDAITGRTLSKIRQQVRKAVNFVDEWIRLQESNTIKSNDYAYNQAQQLQKELANLHQTVLEELNVFYHKNSSVLLTAGIDYCRTAVEDIRDLFEETKSLRALEPEIKYLLHAELLKIPSLLMDSDWQPEIKKPELLAQEIINLVTQNNFSWKQAFNSRIENKDHEATERIIEFLQVYTETSIDSDELQKQREIQIKNCQQELKQAVNNTRKLLEANVALGVINENDRLDYVADIESIETAIPKTLRFGANISHLQKISDEINTKRQQEIDEKRKELKELIDKIGLDNTVCDRISGVLDKGDIFTANEYINMVQQNRQIPEVENRREVFKDFFNKENYTSLEKELEPADLNRTARREIILNISKSRNIGLLHMQQVPGAQAKKASEMLESWFKTKTAKKADSEEDVRTILSNLGFNTGNINIKQKDNYTWINITTKPIQEKNSCPVPAFGSKANGNYRILCVWHRPSEEEILNAIGDTSHGCPVLVFHFGRMTEKKRRDLARLSRERRRTFIVIDDIVMLYLCGERGVRLPVLFDCTLPFTFLEPYTTTASEFVPEMFYGREQERQSIIHPMGSCLIYGGRQLGKTVLLRYVQRDFNALNQEYRAGFLDIKQVGAEKPLDEIWSCIISKLEEMNIFDAKRRNLPNSKTLQQIKSWLELNNQRHILLLLDEADNFLEADSKEGFPRCDELRRLMLETNRRFKVVFAGLHNVLRTTKQVNHPLAHFGTPICIGPLLKNGEMREARALIERPFASVGYRFESPDLVTRILSQTNYYPSLIQLYCQQLLKHVTNPDVANFNTKDSPPYVITSQQVDDAYNNQDLRKAILDRFLLTLQLDQRYAVIAYAIAFSSINSDKGMVNGFNVSWIRNEVLTWWYEGFQGLSLDEIQVLLEEMEGLGVLRRTNTGSFTLRSRNVLLLMGTQEEIEATLLQHRELPLEYEPSNFRSVIGIKDNFQRSPLTAQQESKLLSPENGVSIISGTLAAGLEDLKLYLESVLSKKNEYSYYYWEDLFSQEDFAQRLKLRISKRPQDCITLIVISAICSWNHHWVQEAREQIKRLRSQTSFVQLVFVATPQNLWQLLNNKHTDFNALNSLTNLTLKPWHDVTLRQWLEDCNYPSDQDSREKITAVTGNWPALIYRFYHHSQSHLHNWELHLEGLKESFNDWQEARDFITVQLGIDRYEQKKVLRALADWCQTPEDSISTDELVDLNDDIQPDIVRKVLLWADLLNLVIPVRKKKEHQEYWRIAPVVGRLLEAMED